MLRALRNLLLPRGVSPRKLRLGLAKGATTLIDFELDTAFYFGTYESEMRPYLRRLVRPGTKCFDVGGYRGWYAIIFATLSGEKVLSFEANDENADFMKQAFECGGHDVEIVREYVAGKDAEREITLDTAAERYGMPDFVKMDIEGAEADVLEGATRVLKQGPALFIEVHGKDIEARCLSTLRAAGYEPRIIDMTSRWLREARSDLHNRWLVCDPMPSPTDPPTDLPGRPPGA